MAELKKARLRGMSSVFETVPSASKFRNMRPNAAQRMEGSFKRVSATLEKSTMKVAIKRGWVIKE